MEDKSSLGEYLIKIRKVRRTLLTSLKEKLTILRDNSGPFTKYIKRWDPKVLLATFMIVSILAMGFTGYKVHEIKTRALELYLDEDMIAVVRDGDKALATIEELKADLSREFKANIVLDKEVKFKPGHAKDHEITSEEELKRNIKSKINLLVTGFAIVIDGEEIGVLKTEKEAKDIIEEVKNHYLDHLPEEAKIKEVKIKENIEFKQKDIPISEIASRDKLIQYIKEGSEEIRTHTVEVGESFWTIAKIYNTTVEELIDANPDRDPEKLKPGDEVKLLVPTSKLTVETVEEVEYVKAIDYEVEVELNNNMYKNQQKTKVEGKKGESKILANQVRHNGILFDKEIIKEETIKEPVTQVVVKGTKDVPKTVATGAFLMPTRGRISSRYGRRWGRMHYGLDISAPTGTAIKAADGGTVSFAGYQGSYGYMVEINHGNGYKTRYAHCSKLHVRAGQKVYKGQHIANVGNTGRSTGPHLHFEVLRNGVNVNPSNFIR